MSALYNVTTPTRMQTDLIPHLTHPTTHLYVRQTTGSGKTFAIACSLLSIAIQEHHMLTQKLQCTSAKAHEIQALNTLVVVPNRELALQIVRWAHEMLEHAYPQMSRAKVIQCVVGGKEYESVQKGVLKRHGMPAILVGTPKTLMNLMASSDTGAPLVTVLPPEMLRRLSLGDYESAAEYAKRLHSVHVLSKQSMKTMPAGGLRGLRRLVIDEIDQVLCIPGKNATEREKKLRKDKPKPGQLLIDQVLLDTCKLSRLNAVVHQAGLLGWQKREVKEVAQQKPRIRRWIKDRDPLLGPPAPVAQPVETVEPNRDLMRLRELADLVGRQSLQITALSATANSAVRQWMQKRGWMSSRPLVIDNEDTRVTMPSHVEHYCLVVEDQNVVRNFRAKDEASEQLANEPKDEPGSNASGAKEADADVWAEDQMSAMELMAEVAANTFEALDPRGSVIIFTRSDASTTQFAHVLERYGILAHDIMVYFDATLQSRVDEAVGSHGHKDRRVFIATEEAARGIDVTDTSLVMILDIPKNVASYTHMAGRTGRFNRAGAVVSVVPVGEMGWSESKMRGIFSQLDIRPTKAPFVES
ncbi:hypothetical protein IW148_000055 [Coemansia sp. RSA 1199]|nr:hypothetical protein IW148_000055 [Coemansia sp. RSA 1199]